jgi:hypothetical protein
MTKYIILGLIAYIVYLKFILPTVRSRANNYSGRAFDEGKAPQKSPEFTDYIEIKENKH